MLRTGQIIVGTFLPGNCFFGEQEKKHFVKFI